MEAVVGCFTVGSHWKTTVFAINHPGDTGTVCKTFLTYILSLRNQSYSNPYHVAAASPL